MKNVCVYCSSSDAVDPLYFTAAGELGRLLAVEGYTLVFGGTNVGLMGELARSVHLHGGRVIGVIPQIIRDRGIAFDDADELITTADLRERKAIMESQSDAFIAMPGGFGTLEEILEVITLKQLGLHAKPVIFLNTHKFYHTFNVFLEELIIKRLTKPAYRKLYYFAAEPALALSYLKNYQPVELESKWF